MSHRPCARDAAVSLIPGVQDPLTFRQVLFETVNKVIPDGHAEMSFVGVNRAAIRLSPIAVHSTTRNKFKLRHYRLAIELGLRCQDVGRGCPHWHDLEEPISGVKVRLAGPQITHRWQP